MQITLHGTGAAEGIPGLFCRCDICRQAIRLGGKNLRTRTTALIDGVLKIDLPPDTHHHVLTQGLDLTTLETLLFTHGHDDHLALPELQYKSWMFVPYPIERKLRILAPADVAHRIAHELDLDTVQLSIRCLTLWEMFPAGRYSITPMQANHEKDISCHNYLIDDGSKTLLYATDTGWWDEPTWRFLVGKRIDGAVIECTKGLDEGGYKQHLSVPELIRMRERLLSMGTLAAGSPVVTTHHSHMSGLLHEDYERLLAPRGITPGYDGLVFEI